MTDAWPHEHATAAELLARAAEAKTQAEWWLNQAQYMLLQARRAAVREALLRDPPRAEDAGSQQ